MKTLETLTYNGINLSVMIETEDSKASANFFVNGLEITDWGKLKPIFQTLLSALLDQYCEDYKLIKWRY